METTSRYTVIEQPAGFRVEGGPDRLPVEVRLMGTHWTVTGLREGDEYPYANTYGLFGYRSMLQEIARRLMEPWTPPEDHHPHYWSGIYEWACARTRRAIAGRVYGQWQRLLGTLPAAERQVCRAVFAATFDSCSLGCESWEELYSSPLYARLVGDICKYRAAAVACHNAERLVCNLADILRVQREVQRPTPPFPGPDELRFAAASALQSPFMHSDEERQAEKRQHQARRMILDALAEDWKGLFSPSGLAYPSLNQVLMQLPGGIPQRLCNSFPYAQLARPIADRIELSALLLFAEEMMAYNFPGGGGYFHQRPPWQHWAYPIFAKASRADILRALLRLSDFRHQPSLRAGTASNLNALVRLVTSFATDHPDGSHKGNIVGLTERALRERAREYRENLARKLAGIDRDAPLATPPIPLPDTPAIRLLRTAGEVIEEGERMEHCIGDFADAAIAGRVYIFHVDYRDSEASAMVNCLGLLEQCHGGPRGYRINQARDYGVRALSRWGKALGRAPASAPMTPGAEPPSISAPGGAADQSAG